MDTCAFTQFVFALMLTQAFSNMWEAYGSLYMSDLASYFLGQFTIGQCLDAFRPIFLKQWCCSYTWVGHWITSNPKLHSVLQTEGTVSSLVYTHIFYAIHSDFQNQSVHLGPVSWRPTSVEWRLFSQSNCHSTIGTRQTEYHDALLLSANDEVRCDCMFADDGNASWYSVCRVPMVKWRLDCKNCCHLTVIGLLDTSPWSSKVDSGWANDFSIEICCLSLTKFSVV